MRFTDFLGVMPKMEPINLPPNGAVVAENLELYGSRLQPHAQPLDLGPVIVDIEGNPFVGRPITLHKSDGVWIAFPEHTFIAPDPQNRSGPEGFLFVRDKRLYRSSGRAVRDGEPPVPVGIAPPESAPTAIVAPGMGCREEFPALLCVPNSDPDCADGSDAPIPTAYLATYVTACDEESAPSPVSEIVDRLNGDGAILSLPGPHPDNAIAIRWYRSITTSEGEAIFVRAGESPIDQALYTDNLCLMELGGRLDTERHLPPHDCIDGVAIVANAVTLIWAGKRIWASEPRLPHAYPPEWERTVLYDIVGVYGVTPFVEQEVHYWAAILTEGFPYSLTGQLPENLAVREVQAKVPALSPMVAIDEGMVFYPTDSGIAAFSGNNVEVITQDSHTEIEWQQWSPKTQRLIFSDGRVFGFWGVHGEPHSGGFILPVSRYRKDRRNLLTTLTIVPDAVYTDADDALYFARYAGGDATATLAKWGAGKDPMRYTWRSKPITQSGRWHPRSMKVVADFGRRTAMHRQGALAYAQWQRRLRNSGNMFEFFRTHPEYQPFMADILNERGCVTVRVYADGELFYEREVDHSEPFLLPMKRKAIEWAVEVQGHMNIREVHMQTSGNDLTQEGGHA